MPSPNLVFPQAAVDPDSASMNGCRRELLPDPNVRSKDVRARATFALVARSHGRQPDPSRRAIAHRLPVIRIAETRRYDARLADVLDIFRRSALGAPGLK